jgi:hypothetical protein
MTTTNKRYSYPRVAMIRINVHPAGENPINTPHAFNTQFTYGPGSYISRGPRNLSLVPTRRKHAPTPGRSLGDRRQTGPTVILSHLIPPPSRQPWSRGERFRPSGNTTTLTYWAHNSSMRSTSSILARWGPTHRSLNDTGESYNLEVAGFLHTIPRPSQPTVLPFPPKGPA